MIDRTGQQLGNYQILRSIGYGGFADVYLGEHLYLQTQVAIKLLQTRLATEDMEGFLTEARIIAHLVHPHIVRVLDFGIEGSTPFLVMDYASGGTLRQRHPKGTRLALDTVVNYTKQVAQALQYAHEKKLIHRDIKPENMLLGENDQILLSDFGIALIAQSTRYQNTQAVIGTAAYMAPEQLQGKPRQASDQYALGIVVYEWLSGERPFHGSFTEIYSQHMFVPPPPLRVKIPDLPPTVEEVVFTALTKDPKERFTTIQAFATALEQACQVASSPPTTLATEFSSPSQPLPPASNVTAFPSQQVSKTENAEVSIPPTRVLSTALSRASSSAARFPRDGNSALVPKTRRHLVIANWRQSLHVSRSVLLIGLVFLVLIGGLGLFNIVRTNQLATSNAYTTSTAHMSGTNTANAASTETATALNLNHIQATSGTPVLDDPLIDNSKGNNWPEWNNDNGACIFTGGAYHAIIRPAFSGGMGCFKGSANFSNLAYQVEMTIIKGDGGGGLLFRNGGGPDPNGWGYQFGLFRDHVGLWYGGTTFSSATAIKAQLNQTYLLTAIARGNTIDVYIDKQWVGSTKDNTSSSGSIALSVYGQANFTEVVFRNVKVWIL